MLTSLVVFTIAAVSNAVPPSLAVPAGASLSLRAEGRGVQVYVCEAKPDEPGAYHWSFKAPLANLYSREGEVGLAHIVQTTMIAAGDGQACPGGGSL